MLSQRENRRAKFANRLIAENMFAIVRLELAHATDQVVNNALYVKRQVTGSGNAEFALNVTGTLVMLAGNVLTGGGMSLLGNLLVAAGEMAQAAAKNDASGFAKGALHGVSGVVAASTPQGRAAFQEQQESGYQFASKSTVEDGEVETRSHSEGVGELITTAGEAALDLLGEAYERTKGAEPEVGTYTVVRRKTAWIPHGAGGTNAITNDVQEAMNAAYSEGLTTVARELGSLRRQDLPADSTLLGRIVKSRYNTNMGDALHPMTAWVLERAVEKLATTGGGRYQAITGGSGMLGRESVRAAAQQRVKLAYKHMLTASGALASTDDIVQKLPPV